MQYDSTLDTDAHITEVKKNVEIVVRALRDRAKIHDLSKYKPDEKAHLDLILPALKKEAYGSPEYLAAKKGLGQFLSLHHARNSHHPEHYPNGIAGMDILDLIEMVCDWISSNAPDSRVTIEESVEINIKRFGVEPQLSQILRNTISKWPNC